MKDSFKLFNKDFLEKTQLYMCGFDLRIRTPQGTFVDESGSNMWSHFENIMTNNGINIKNSEYREWLKKCDDNGRLNYGVNEKYKDEWYQRRWTKPIFTYGTMYNEADVALATIEIWYVIQ